MASSRTKAWGQPTPPSSAFLIKCAKEKEKLRSKFRRQLQEHMLHMLNEGLYTNIVLGVNAGKFSSAENRILTPKQEVKIPQFLHAHKSVLKVRTPAFLEHVHKHQEFDLFGDASYQTYLEETELKEFLKKVYTDDDIRKHECEAVRISKTYADILCEKKSLLNKHIIDSDEFEKEESVHSTCTENFVTPKTSPLTPDRLLDLPDILQMKQNQYKTLKIDENIKMRKNDQINSETSEKELKSGTPNQADLSEGYISEFDNTQNDEESILDLIDLKISQSALALNSTEISSTSVDIDESVLDELCSPITAADASDDSDHSRSSPSASGMVRSNTFDLHTQAPLEDFIEKMEDNSKTNADLSTCHKLDSFHGLEDSIEIEGTSSKAKSETPGFYLHDKTPSPKPNIFNLIENHAQPNVHFRRTDGSMSDSGFMSYSTFSTVSDGMSTSLMLSESNSCPPTKGGDETSSNLERSKRLSGSMFPFYIDINNLPPDRSDSIESKKNPPSSVYMFIDASKPKGFLQPNDSAPSQMSESVDLGVEKALFTRFRSVDNINREKLTKAVSTPHLHNFRDFQSSSQKNAKAARPQSCYMYIDLDSIEEKNKCQPPIKRAPSSVSMYVDLNDDSFNLLSSPKTLNNNNMNDDFIYSNLNEIKPTMERNKSPIDNYKALQTTNISDSKRKLSDSYLSKYEDNFSKIRFHSLRKPGENLSDSELNSIFSRERGKSQIIADLAPHDSRSLYDPSEVSFVDNVDLKHEKLFSSFELKQDISDPYLKFVDSDHFQQKEKYSEMKFLNTAFNDLLFPRDCSKSKQVVDTEIKKNNDIDKETGLLPMSPILRRKMPSRDQPKPSPPVIVKASTRPQDLDAMKFPVPKKDGLTKGDSLNSVLSDNIPAQPCGDSTRKKQDSVDDSKSSNDSSRVEGDASCSTENANDKIHEPMSRSESSAITVSGGETSSSDKVIVTDTSKDRTKSPLSCYFPCDLDDDVETVYSEVSDLSSSLCGLSGVASLERRWREGYTLAKDASAHGIHNMYRMLEACSKLGEDLLRMFLEEIDTDIAVEVEGRIIKAHRCILVSRCKYFATLLKGDAFANGEAINLEGFSYLSVHFALCHIYSGAMNMPKDVNIIELGLLAEVLGLDTLIDVIILHLKTHYCHFFHKPCPQCTQGVVECLPLVVACGFTDLRDKSIHWLGKYFTRTWTNKLFAALPDDLHNLCFQSTVKNLSIETVIEMTLNCDRIITTLPHLKWTEPIFGMVTNLLQECIHFMANNFNKVLCSEGFLVLGKGQSWSVSALEDDIMSSVELMTPDVACKSCVKVSQILSLAESGGYSDYGEFTQNFIDLLHKISRGCERYLIHNANKVVHCQSWACLPPEIQKKIKDAAVIVFEFEKPTAKPPRLSSLHRKWKKQNKDDENYGYFESSTYPKPFKGAKNYANDISERTFCIQRKAEKDKKNLDHRKDIDLMGKKLVSPIKEESQANGPDSKRSVDPHEEDSLKEMQDLPHDHSVISQNIFLDVSQHSSSAGNLESEDNHSGTHCSDNPDSLDANEDISMDSKDDLDGSMHIEDELEKEKLFRVNTAPVTEINNRLHAKAETPPCIPVKRISHSPVLYTSKSAPDNRESVISSIEEKKNPRNYGETSPTKRSPVKSFVPLSKTHLLHEKETLSSQGKDLVAEIDADSRMVTHCLQEAEMLEQQLSRKLHQQKAVSSNRSQYDRCNPGHVPCSEVRRSRISVNKVQKSLSTSQMKNLTPASVRGKSPGKLTPSPSSPLVPRVARISDVRETKSSVRKPLQSPKANYMPSQKSFRSADGVVSTPQKPVAASKRISTRATRSRSSVIATVRDNRTSHLGPK